MPLAICDRCGFEYHLSELRKEWTGLMVCDADYDPKPRDLTPPKLRAEGLPLRNARPEPEPIWVSPEVYLYGVSTAQAVVAGTLYVGPGAGYRPLSGAITGIGAATATLRTALNLSGSIAANGATAGSLRVAVSLSGSIANANTLTGTFDRANALSGMVAGAGVMSGAITVAVRMSGVVAATGALTGAMKVSVSFVGAVAGAGSATGSMTNAGAATRNKRMGDIANLIGYHSVADRSTMTLDGSNGVSEWRARDGSTVLQQTTASRRPPYVASVASIGNKPALMMTADSRMEFTTPGVFPKDTMGHTILLLYRGTVNKQNVLILSWGSGAGPWRLAGYGNSGTNTWAAMPLGDHNSTNSALNVTSLMVHTMASGSDPLSTHYVNGGAGQTKQFTGTPSNGATGASIGWTQFYDVINAEGVILEAIAVFNGVLSTSDRHDAEAIMAYEHGQEALIGSPTRPTVPV